MKVLLVDDSRAVRAYVEGILRREADIDVISASDGASGVKLVREQRPDVVLMDLELPEMDGLEAIRSIMENDPCPIVVLSAYLDDPGRNRTFESLHAGAVEVLAKPGGLDAASIAAFRARLLNVVRWMSKAVVVRRRPLGPRPTPLGTSGPRAIVVIGASTGGPQVVAEILKNVPPPIRHPVVLAQHIVPGFEHGFATWLAQTGHRVLVVDADTPLEPGRVYIARADRNLTVHPGRLVTVAAQEGTNVPSVDVLFESAAASYGNRVAAILLSGMGTDGARGLLTLRRRGALTVTQSGATCVIDGMPGAARSLNASEFDLPPGDIVAMLKDLPFEFCV